MKVARLQNGFNNVVISSFNCLLFTILQLGNFNEILCSIAHIKYLCTVQLLTRIWLPNNPQLSDKINPKFWLRKALKKIQMKTKPKIRLRKLFSANLIKLYSCELHNRANHALNFLFYFFLYNQMFAIFLQISRFNEIYFLEHWT